VSTWISGKRTSVIILQELTITEPDINDTTLKIPLQELFI